MISSSDIGPPIVSRICSNVIAEMKAISTVAHNSFLSYTVESVKQFSWEAVYEELQKHMPTLMTLVNDIIPNATEHKPLHCMIASQLLKADIHTWAWCSRQFQL